MKKSRNAKSSVATTVIASEKSSSVNGNTSNTREVLFVVPAHLTRPFFLELYGGCEEQIHDSKLGLRPILRCVRSDDPHTVGSKVTTMLDREKYWTDSGQIAAILVAPTGDKELERSVARFSARERIPVIALSLPFQHDEAFVDEGLPVPPFVASNGAKGAERLGRHAAEMLHDISEEFKSLPVLLVPGHAQRSDSRSRLEQFKAGMLADEEVKSKLVFDEIDPCGWQRLSADKAISKYLKEKPAPVVIFCANDSMALGCVDSLHRHQDLFPVFVFGFDATDEAMSRLEDPDERFFSGTVSQNMSLIAQGVKNLLGQMLQTEDAHLKPWISMEVPADAKVRPNHRQPKRNTNSEVQEYRHADKELWIDEKNAGSIAGAPTADTLKQNRLGKEKETNKKTGRHRKRGNDHQGEWGIDKDGRQWRKSPKLPNGTQPRRGFIWLKRTIVPNP